MPSQCNPPSHLADADVVPSRFRHPKCSAIECDSNHIWTQCPDSDCQIDIEKKSGWGVLRHSGTHRHVWPSSKKADPLAMRVLTEQLVSNPKAGPLVLKVGQPGAGQTVTAPVVEIHPAFGNGGRLGYLRHKVLIDKGLMPEKESHGGGDRLIMDLMHWGRNSLRLISTSLSGANVHITYQSEWMAEQLVCRDQDNRVYSGGLLSDVTYQFFNHGYLLTTSMYSDIMHCWVPIQLTWMWGLDESHYESHFTTLLEQISTTNLTYHERDLLVQQVVDFSTAQKKGFVSAYMKVFNEYDPAKALSKLKGCHEHYRQSITRVKKNRNIVDASRVKFDQMARLFPKSKAWVDWWNTSDIHSMLFCGRERLPLDDPPLPDEDPLMAEVPDTTNGQESMHRQYYILTSGHCTIVQGFVQLLLFTESLKKDFNQILRGISVKYGSNWTSVVKTLGWSKERTRRKPEANDGRPPDTTDALIRPKKAGRPAGSLNMNRDPHSSYQSYAASNDPGKRNRCWETASLESFYPTFSPLWMTGSNGKGKDLASKLIRHYSSRASAELHQSTHVKSVLSRGLKSLQSAVQKIADVSFVTNTFCSADLFLDYILATKHNLPTLVGRHFSYQMIRDYQCPLEPAHQPNESVTRTSVSITSDLFRDANLRYHDITALLYQWHTEGLYSTSPWCCPNCRNNRKQQAAVRRDYPDDDHEELPGVTESANELPQLFERNRLDFTSNSTNIYFHLANAAGLKEEDRDNFMGDMEWPETLTFNDVDYHIVSRGFWGYCHYWCKVVRHVDGAQGVWFYDDCKDDGRAQLLGRELSLIAGAQPMTSWLVYSRKASSDEQKVIKSNIAKISQKNPDSHGDLPFVSAVDLDGVKEEIEQLCKEEENQEEEEDENENKEDEIEEDVVTAVPANVGVPTTTIGDLAKHAFASTYKSKKAKEAFSSTCPPAIIHHKSNGAEANEHPNGRALSQPTASSGDGASKGGIKFTEPTQGAIRLRIKRPAPESSPVKSPSPSPQKDAIKASKRASRVKKGVSKGEVLQDIKPNLPFVEMGKGAEGEEVEAKVKAKPKPKAKGRKPKVARV
ncbi:uncharacterized protein MELLADRAFT_89278 [Melampsora larici-populina 98AG31]|uniref:USP domain-containing protein n=1 Tax=Melampsora larici-populina (strain 98AG31 / pathotype 3-4-7) TaxID=747676 RepID=F4R5K8_MELLP|nr:uncharacterized protein MELLADRAFT_89278 [Melampsora larici-populina 98AG31]EGG12243.1 hypothetical protein MELLADRAFT_89278 [Melampsora larici-populina 98AG31]